MSHDLLQKLKDKKFFLKIRKMHKTKILVSATIQYGTGSPSENKLGKKRDEAFNWQEKE